MGEKVIVGKRLFTIGNLLTQKKSCSSRLYKTLTPGEYTSALTPGEYTSEIRKNNSLRRIAKKKD